MPSFVCVKSPMFVDKFYVLDWIRVCVNRKAVGNCIVMVMGFFFVMRVEVHHGSAQKQILFFF